MVIMNIHNEVTVDVAAETYHLLIVLVTTFSWQQCSMVLL